MIRLRPCRVGLFDQVRTFERRRGVHRRHHGHAVDRDRLVIGRAGAAAAAVGARLRINQTNPKDCNSLISSSVFIGVGLVCSIERAPGRGRCGGRDGQRRHRRLRSVVEREREQFRPRVMADLVHHPLALDDQRHVEIGDEDAFAAGERRREMARLPARRSPSCSRRSAPCAASRRARCGRSALRSASRWR